MLPSFLQADATKLPFADDAFDFCMGSPPYCDARSYGISAQRGVADWVDWMLTVTDEAVRVSKGLVIWIAAGVTRKWNYWPACEGLMWEWFKRGGQAWRPAYWHRVGIPGSGGKQWLRADVEYAMCFTKCKAAVPFADNTANGHPPKWAPGGEMSYRTADGERVNGWDAMFAGGDGTRGQGRDKAGNKLPKKRLGRGMANGIPGSTKGSCVGRRIPRGKDKNGEPIGEDAYLPPVLANPGVLIKGIKVGGGLMGHPLAHVNEAPYPVKLAQWFIRGWCPPAGSGLDPFSGSGTTAHAAISLGRRAVGCDLRFSQCELGRKRCRDVQPEMF